MASQIKYTDMGLGKIIKQAQKLQNVTLAVGVVGPKAQEQHGDSGLTNAEIALIQHFGTEHIPARPFLSRALTRHRATIKLYMEHVARQVVQGGLPLEELANAGRKIAGLVRGELREGFSTKPRLAASTQARTGRVLALMDSLQMYDAINFQIIDKNAAAVEAEETSMESAAEEIGADGDGGQTSAPSGVGSSEGDASDGESEGGEGGAAAAGAVAGAEGIGELPSGSGGGAPPDKDEP